MPMHQPYGFLGHLALYKQVIDILKRVVTKHTLSRGAKISRAVVCEQTLVNNVEKVVA